MSSGEISTVRKFSIYLPIVKIIIKAKKIVITRYSNVDFANGHVSIIIKGDVFDNHILEDRCRSVESNRLDFQTSNATTVIHSSWLGEIDRKQSTGALLDNNGLLRAVLEHRRLVVWKKRNKVKIQL